MRTRLGLSALIVTLALGLAACSQGSDSADTDSSPTGGSSDQKYPDILEVEVTETGDDSYTFDVTVSSPYDTPERYADGWRVLDANDEKTVYGEHTLGHDHAGEQPFTRTQTGVEIPGDVTEVTIEGRDKSHGYGGETVTVELP